MEWKWKEKHQFKDRIIDEATIATYPLNVPALKSLYRALPREVLRRIGIFAEHTHVFCHVIPTGPRDNNEYTLICRTCGYRLSDLVPPLNLIPEMKETPAYSAQRQKRKKIKKGIQTDHRRQL